MYQNLPAQGALTSITPSDSTALAVEGRAVSFSVAGALQVCFVGGDPATDLVTIPSGALAPGLMHPMAITYIGEATDVQDLVVWT